MTSFMFNNYQPTESTTMEMPPFPTLPPATSPTFADQQVFDNACRLYDLALRTIAIEQNAAAQATRDLHAKAQADTAAAMRDNAAAQREVARAFALPAAEPTLSAEKRALAIALLGQQSIGIRDTEAALVASIGKQVDAVFYLWPKTPISATGA